MSWKHSFWRSVAAAFGRPSRRGWRILGYHSVGTTIPNDPYGLCVSPDSFTKQLDLIASGRFGEVVSLGGGALDGAAEISVTFDDGFRDIFTTAVPRLVGKNLPFTVCVTPGLLDSGRPYLSWNELRELAGIPGCEIGAHGLTHARLDALDVDALARELRDSRRRIEDAIGKTVRVMTWPHGAASRKAADAARNAGFIRAGCSLYGVNAPGRHPLLLKRTEITGFDDADDFIGKCSGMWDWFARRQGDPLAR